MLTAMTRNAVLEEALKLSVKERADVAVELLSSLDDKEWEDQEEVARAWGAEIERRARRALSGESAGSPWEDVKQRIEGRLERA